MTLGLLLAGKHTVVFRCGCLFARGDVAGVAGWRLCREHASLQPMVEEIFGGEEEPCVVTYRTCAGRPRSRAYLSDMPLAPSGSVASGASLGRHE